MTINKLRRQFAKIADMDVDAINSSFDPNRDPDVDPVLWEIRRERMVELMGEGLVSMMCAGGRKPNGLLTKWLMDNGLLRNKLERAELSLILIQVWQLPTRNRKKDTSICITIL